MGLFGIKASRGRKSPFDDEFKGSRNAQLRKQLEGTWHLVSYQLEVEGFVHASFDPLSKNPIGRIIYTRDGYMSVNIMKPGCKPFMSGSPHGGSTYENDAAAAHYLAYSGRYEAYYVRGQKIVNHQLDTSLYPNWLEMDQTREVELKGDELILKPTSMPKFMGIGAKGTLHWKRAPNAYEERDS